MSKHDDLVSKNKGLTDSVEALKQELDSKNKEIEELNKNLKLVKMAKSLEGSGSENKDMKLKINELVKEIDKCIALLNK